MNWGLSARKKAAELFESGLGYKAVSTELGINRETVRDWSYTWRALGTEGFCAAKEAHPNYSPELKLAVVADRMNGDSVVDVMHRYQIPNRHRIKEWCALYQKNGPSVFTHSVVPGVPK